MSIRCCGLIACIVTLALGSAAALAAPVSVGHSGWTWGDPTPQGQALTAVAFDGATGYAVGNFGTILTSTDSGATWTGLSSGTINDLSVVQEVSPSVVIVGGGCTVRESVNGGASFTSLPINPTESSCATNLASVSFSSATTGYVELIDGTMFYTDDAGQTVQAKTSAPVNGAVATDLVFVSPTTGFAVSGAGGSGGVIERTTDGANSWTQVGSSPNGLNAITFVSATQGFAVGDDDTVLETTNGGATWTAQPLTLPAGAGPFSLTHISCSSPTTCLMSTQDGKELIGTTDGGMTGTIINPSSQLLLDVAFSTGSTVVGVGEDGATVLSADGGQTFPTVVSTNLGFTLNASGAGIVAGGTSGSAYITGTSGHIAATVNDGASWTLLRAPTTNDVHDVAFPTTGDGFELETDGTLRSTSDGGVSWASLDTGVSGAAALAATTPTNVLLIGPHGVHRSTDGGSSFRSVSGQVVLSTKPKRTINVARLALTDAQTVGGTVFAWGAGGLFASTSGGGAWKAIPEPLAKGLDGVSFVSPSTGYVLTDGGARVYFTRDLGRKWTQIALGAWPVAAGISFSSASDGLVALADNNFQDPYFDAVDLLATTNGGKTWQPEVIDGEQAGLILATPAADYYDEAGQNGGVNPGYGLFATTDAGLSPNPSTLKISIGRTRLTAKALKKAGDKVTVTGSLSPVTSIGEHVLVSYQTAGRSWRGGLVTVATNGDFSEVIPGISATTAFVAQSVGNGLYGGAGTPLTVLTVKK
ncbi:MAG: WD40/YVTN/BNR-like repeat-containing protein [Solirubrobacteraceae bacterium]